LHRYDILFSEIRWRWFVSACPKEIIMNHGKPLLPVKSDFVFKLIFGDQRNVDILADFLKSVLDIPEAEYEKLTIVDPHVKR